jgi:hypothetical protein
MIAGAEDHGPLMMTPQLLQAMSWLKLNLPGDYSNRTTV